MCGIVGLLGSVGRETESDLEPALEALHHRGPDSRATWLDVDQRVALGHTRLAVIDLSPAGAQPMVSESGKLVLVYNGELYNFAELRRLLEASGVAFRGSSDTEVLLEALDAWGVERTLERADGMFAFGVWNRSDRTLTLARDRMGEKPLYYARAGGSFVFASELSALCALPGVERRIDRDALTLFLRHKYIPAPYTVYQRTWKLPPATTLAVRDPREIPEPVPYWSLFDHLAHERPSQVSPDQAVDELEGLLIETVRERMVADVPLGAFLSGGVDSSLVASAMIRTGAEVKTFTIGFAEAEYNEADHARAVAEHLGTSHTQLDVTPSMALAVVPKLASIYDEPFADSSQIPTFLVSELARTRVTVVLSGDGGDELFGGYNRYLWGPRLLARGARVPSAARRLASRVGLAVPVTIWDRLAAPIPSRYRPLQAGLKVHKAAGALLDDDAPSMLHRLTSHWTDPSRVVIGGSEPVTTLTDPERWPEVDDPTLHMMATDAITYLPDDILTKLDRAAMAVSLETRAPLLAKRIVEFAAGLPLDLKIRDGQSKWLLRRLLDRSVPRRLIERPKAGFGVPLDIWLRGPLKGWAEELLDPALLRQDGYLRPEPVGEVWRRHQAGRENGAYKLWDVLMFQAWLHREDGGEARRWASQSGS